jgi:DNA-directed RNA polymerase subunit RPC12/RpoP
VRDAELDLTNTPADVEFECPRCGLRVSARLYGPCTECSAQLQATISGVPDINAAVTEFEPKMNVTPNAVALKDD